MLRGLVSEQDLYNVGPAVNCVLNIVSHPITYRPLSTWGFTTLPNFPRSTKRL
jgi:hypothetical protein